MASITVIDYGAGNLASVQKGLATTGASVSIVRRADDLDDANTIVIPGVGHFGATAALDDAWRRAIAQRLDRGAALLGICLGMHWLFNGSDEAPDVPGAGLLTGRCTRLSGQVKVPHVGWNTLSASGQPAQLLEGIAPGASVYFTHSFAAPITADTVATSSHGAPFAACVARGRVWGTQFHPEKSGTVGLRILSNFVAAASEGR
jgi:glutamine amidotransferase